MSNPRCTQKYCTLKHNTRTWAFPPNIRSLRIIAPDGVINPIVTCKRYGRTFYYKVHKVPINPVICYSLNVTFLALLSNSIQFACFMTVKIKLEGMMSKMKFESMELQLNLDENSGHFKFRFVFCIFVLTYVTANHTGSGFRAAHAERHVRARPIRQLSQRYL